MDTKGENYYEIETTWECLIREYTGLNFLQISELNYLDYLLYRRDAFIYKMRQTEEGNKYLANAWRLEQAKPDIKQLRKKFGSKER